MKRVNWAALVRLLISPVLQILLGVVLIVNPDSAAVLVAKILGWALILGGSFLGFVSLLGDAWGRVRNLLGALVCLAAGVWLLFHPLVIAQSIGRVLGLVLLLDGAGDLLSSRRRGIAPLLTCGAGLVLLLVPMATSRLFFVVLGMVVLICGVGELANRLRREGFLV